MKKSVHYHNGDIVDVDGHRMKVLATSNAYLIGQVLMVAPVNNMPQAANTFEVPASLVKPVFVYTAKEDMYPQRYGRAIRPSASPTQKHDPVIVDYADVERRALAHYAADDASFITEVMASLETKYRWEVLELIDKLKKAAAKAYLAPK